jgi:uncharacterized membrane protein
MSCGIALSWVNNSGQVLDRDARKVNGWTEFVVAAMVFLASHALPARPGIRVRLASVLGRRTYLTIYSAVSLALFAWLILAAGRAPYVGLWFWFPQGLWIANALMALALVLAVGGTAIANPFSLGGLADRPFDPRHPGILAVTRHPLLWALVLWSAAHLIANGDLAHVLLFGSLGGFSVAGIFAMEKRIRIRAAAQWSVLSRATSLVPFAALLTARASWTELLQVRMALLPFVWCGIVLLHRPTVGVSPLPPL